jgi:phosphoribosyl 1,2-cyclic phosphodiesterase
MRARIWGCRGSLASPGRRTVRYGGNTSCVEVRVDDDNVIILDAGSGMRSLGDVLDAEPRRAIHVLLTHLHLDHLQGLAFFRPFWRDDVELHIWGPASPTRSLVDRIASYLSPPLFPVHLSEVPSRPVFHDVPAEPWAIGDAIVTGVPVSHQGPTTGFRVEGSGRALAYIPDHEPGLGGDLHDLEPEWISGHLVAQGADVLLHDAQYSDAEYRAHVGWGHSSVDHAVAFAQASGVGQLVLFHHDPSHTDADLEVLCRQAAAQWTGADAPVLASDDMTIDLTPEGVAFATAEEPERPLLLA